MEKLKLYYNTIKYMKKNQLYYRLKFRLKRRLYKSFNKQIGEKYLKKSSSILKDAIISEENFNLKSLLQADERDNQTRCNDILKNKFSFINEIKQFSDQIDWNVPDTSQLWKYNLHYCDFLVDLGYIYNKSTKENCYLKFKEVINSWIEANPLGIGDGWHPYPVSLRVVNWIKAYSYFNDKQETDQDFFEKFLQSIIVQALYINNNLEFDVGGNHLLENIRALLAAGLFFSHKGWRNRGLKLLMDQLDEQILEDGGHFERTPMYHLIVLENLLGIYHWLEIHQTAERQRKFIVEKIAEMIAFCKKIVHPDGRIPLFNDSALNIAKRTEDLLEAAVELDINEKSCRRDEMELSASGYYMLAGEEGSNFLVMDCGKICPDYLPAHAHNDLLSYELSLHRERFVVDTGVYEYARGPWRDYNRSTRAHNTVVVNGTEQSQIWDNFRVAKRSQVIGAKREDRENYSLITGEYKGFDSKIGQHRRHILIFRENIFFVIDRIYRLKGDQINKVNSFIHIAPDFELVKQEDLCEFSFKSNRNINTVIPFGIDKVEIHRGEEKDEIQGWYSPDFGRKYMNYVLDLESRDNEQFWLGYLIYPELEKYRVKKVDFTGSKSNFKLNFKAGDSSFVIYNQNDSVMLEEADS